MSGILYIVPTPIGNYDDITVRGLKTLQSVDMVICEEYKEARRLLSTFQITKDLRLRHSTFLRPRHISH